MELIDAAEALAISEQTTTGAANDLAVLRWQELLPMNSVEAHSAIEELSNFRGEIAQRCTRKTYFHSSTKADRSTYLAKMDGSLQDLRTVQLAGGLSKMPLVHQGERQMGTAKFYEVSATAERSPRVWLNENHPLFNATIVRRNLASKDLRDLSMAPFLGRDARLPQNRPDTEDCVPEPGQSEFPVWYFFYGKLAEPERLQELLGLTNAPKYERTQISGARMKSWRCIFRALLDGEGHEWVNGSAFSRRIARSGRYVEGIRDKCLRGRALQDEVPGPGTGMTCLSILW